MTESVRRGVKVRSFVCERVCVCVREKVCVRESVCEIESAWERKCLREKVRVCVIKCVCAMESVCEREERKVCVSECSVERCLKKYWLLCHFLDIVKKEKRKDKRDQVLFFTSKHRSSFRNYHIFKQFLKTFLQKCFGHFPAMLRNEKVP